MKVITRTSIDDEFAVFLEVDANTLQEILSDDEFYNDRDLVGRAMAQRGEHAVMLVLSVNGDVEVIREKISELLETHKSVSWYDRAHRRYFTQTARKEGKGDKKDANSET